MKKSKTIKTLLVILTIFISFIMFQDKALAKVRMSKFIASGAINIMVLHLFTRH